MTRGNSTPFESVRGIGLIEVVISLAVLSSIVIGLIFITTGQRTQSVDFSNTTSCYTLTAGITSAVKAYDNSLIVRNWLPKLSTNLQAALAGSDPFCSGTGGRTPVCDTFALFTNRSGSSYIDEAQSANFQNIRGAFTWAQSVYNTNRMAGICRAPGMTLTPVQMESILPSRLRLPAWATSYQLYIKDKELNCGDLSTSKGATLELKVTALYRNSKSPGPNAENCSSVITITSPVDSLAPTLTVQGVRNLDGDVIPPGACSDRRTVPQIIAAGGPGTNWQTIFIDLLASEPGTLLSCRKAGAFELDPPERYYNCPDMPIGGVLSTTPSEDTVSFNVPLQARLAMNGMPDRDQDMHIYEVKAIDVGGNESNLTSTSFRVHTPICIDRDRYCPNAIPAVPPTWLFQNIFTQPYDDCLNGLCPQGTHSYCDPAAANAICDTQTYQDDCGLDVCRGSIPASSCAGVALGGVPCGQIARGPCGANCGIGQMGCGSGGGPGGTSAPTPPPGCDCSAFDPTTFACGTMGDDSCGNPGICGPGTQGCSPTPGPFTGTWGPYQCTRRNGRQNCNSGFPIPPGYQTYVLTFYFVGQRLDNEPYDSTIGVGVNFGGQSYSQRGSGWAIGPYSPPTHMAMPGFPGPQTFTVTVAPGSPPPTLSFSLYVEDSSVQAFWTLNATNP